jgi:hypothetical protein
MILFCTRGLPSDGGIDAVTLRTDVLVAVIRLSCSVGRRNALDTTGRELFQTADIGLISPELNISC